MSDDYLQDMTTCDLDAETRLGGCESACSGVEGGHDVLDPFAGIKPTAANLNCLYDDTWKSVDAIEDIKVTPKNTNLAPVLSVKAHEVDLDLIQLVTHSSNINLEEVDVVLQIWDETLGAIARGGGGPGMRNGFEIDWRGIQYIVVRSKQQFWGTQWQCFCRRQDKFTAVGGAL